MKVSYRWLKELVDFDLEPDDLAENLTMIGLEAEGLYYQKEMYNKIVVGQILSIKSHPKADNLIICKVDIGKERLNILSAAKNLSVGEKIPVATVQAKLPTGKKIEKVDIKGISSDGMICSAMDLDLEEISEGIMVLDKKAPIGEEIARVLKLDDITIDISVAPNRPDCLSMIGVAREIASILDKKVKLTEYSVVEEEKDIESLTSVVIEDTDLCPRYTARVVKDVNISSSPQWIQQKLRAVGLRPI
ncbi:MAG TPA: phenylalanine--tRNA ligase subunit beta, partial [Nitrospinota bacterium]|nr:phenylalanine--tRNA ligase subunit beta [Nitrospinota bacterium]